ncbi:Nn.00g046030.m01.CDS01 [Neocucurbitaria sp. VM-36]
MASLMPTSRPMPTNDPNADGTDIATPEYRDEIPLSTRTNIIVPMLREHDPEWTSKGNGLTNALPSFPSLITLPAPQTQPALYAAAVDTIRISNWRFKEHGPYTRVLLEKHVKKQAEDWRKQFPNEEKYPLPPDLRTLYVKTGDKHPAPGEGGKPLWTLACEEFQAMKDFGKPGFLRKTRAQHIRENELEGRGVEQEERLYLRIFKRYLAWKEHAERADERRDQQPTRKEMQDLFAKAEVQKTGATLADICHAFPDAKDIEMLIFRIEGFAVFTVKPDEKEEPVENVYMPKPAPNEHEIEEQVSKVLNEHGPLSLEELQELMYPFGFGHEHAVASVVKNIAKPTLTGNMFGLEASPGPSAARIRSVMSPVNGHTFEALVQSFSDRLLLEAALLAPLKEVAYQDSDGLWYPRYFQANDQLLMDDDRNRLRRTEERLYHMVDNSPLALARLLNDVAVWDSGLGRYVKKVETKPVEIEQEVEIPPVSPSSRTEVGTPPSSQPRASKIKRKRSEEDEPRQATKKTKHQVEVGSDTVLVRCNGTTQQGRQCKKKQRRLRGETYNCGKHK